MKQIGLFIIFGVSICCNINAQTIPFGNSFDSIIAPGDGAFTSYLNYYKPASYDSINSPILLAIHGIGGDGTGIRNVLTGIADRQNALIVAPAMLFTWQYAFSDYDSITQDAVWMPLLFKEIYKHVKTRENRDSIPVYFTGWSAGAQCVTRTMLIRQAIPDSIPIVSAMSVNPGSYTFCTDTFQSVSMPYPWGLDGGLWFNPFGTKIELDFICNQHIQQYYNENYNVLIGTTDTIPVGGISPGLLAQGTNRYERAQNFYAFSDTNAIARGTTLLWQYDTVSNVAHNANLMYNTKVNPTDSFTIAENMLFNTPWHPVPTFVPIANFNAADTGLTVTFTDATLNAPSSWFWDFGDGDTSLVQNPVYTYSSSGTYYVCLTAGDSCVTDSYCDSVTIIAVGIDEVSITENINLYPNPNNGNFIIEIENLENTIVEIYNISGQLILQKSLTKNTTKVDLTKHPKEMYFIRIETDNKTIVKKIVYQ